MGIKSREYLVSDPNMNEYVFHCIVSAPPRLINKLPEDLFHHTKSIVKIRTFAQKASLEKKLEMLSHLGGAFSLMLHPPNYLTKIRMDKALLEYNAGKRLDTVNEMIKDKVFVITDKDVMAVHAIMSQNCHSETYMLNRDYALIAEDLVNTRYNNRDSEVKSLMEDYKLTVKMILTTLLNQEHNMGQIGYKPREILVLLYLFINKSKYVDEQEIIKYFTTYIGKVSVRSALGLLQNSLHVQRMPGKWWFSITGLGVQLVSSYVNRIATLALP